jgi:outer membrane biosynthesis protein TonB
MPNTKGEVMENITRITALALCLLIAAMPAVAGQAPKEASAWMRARIVLDADGTLDSVEWLDTKPGDRVITTRLDEVVRGWEFEPAAVNGVAVATETGLTMHVTANPDAEGGMAISIGSARTGAMGLLQAPPRYPVDEVRNGNQALLELQVDTDASGNVVAAKVVGFEGTSKSKYSRQNFEKSVLEVAKSWTYQTEQVAGKGQPVSMRVPVSFCMDDTWCAGKQSELAAKGERPADMPANLPVALSSVVKIKARPSQGDI